MREDWVECTLGDVTDVKGGKRLPKGHYYSKVNTGIYYLRVKDFGFNTINKENLKTLSQVTQELISNYIISKNDIYISIAGTIGKSGWIDDTLDGANLTENAAKIIGTQVLNKKYLVYYLNSSIAQKQISIFTKATSQPKLALFRIKKIITPIPSIVEQKAIVTKIEELFSSLDHGIADLKKAQKQLKIYRQAVLKKAFEGELTKEWREKQTDLPTADELLELVKEERQNHYKQKIEDWKKAVKVWEENGKEGKKPVKPKFIKELNSLTPEEFEKLPDLNKYWLWVKIDKIAAHEANSLKAGPFGSSLKKEFYTKSGYKIYGQEQVISGDHKYGNYYVNQEKFDSLINCSIQPYDILISLVGTVGKVLVLPQDCENGIINPRLVKITLNSFYDSIFFKYYFESSFLKSIYKLKAHGATMDILNLGIIKELPYPLCTKSEQQQIVKEIESRLSVCDKVEQSIKESLEKAQALRQSILKKAFEGTLLSKDEIAACKAHHDYEPASVLLEKIKTEKKKA